MTVGAGICCGVIRTSLAGASDGRGEVAGTSGDNSVCDTGFAGVAETLSSSRRKVSKRSVRLIWKQISFEYHLGYYKWATPGF